VGAVELVVVEAGGDEGAEKATTRSAPGATRRPSPTDAVGKWFADAPTLARRATAPVDGLSP
jgi:hypothetical protein